MQQELITIWNNGVQEGYLDVDFSNRIRQMSTSKCYELLLAHQPDWNFSDNQIQMITETPDQRLIK